jgi:hypothetical protein
MTAVLYDDVVATPAVPKLAPKRLPQPPIGGGDPLVDATARLLGIPLRQVYAVLWRLGLIEVR